MGRTRRVVKGSVVLCAQIFVRFLLAFFIPPLIAAQTGANGLGAYSFLIQIIGFSALFDLGAAQALLKEFAQAYARKDLDRQRGILTSALAVLAIAGLLGAAFLVVIAESVPRYIHGDPATLSELKSALSVLAVWIAIKAPLSAFQTITYASQRISAYGAALLTIDILELALMPCAIHWKMGLQGLVLVIIFAEVLGCLLCLKISLDVIKPLLWKSKVESRNVIHLIRVGFPMAVMSIGDRLTYQTHGLLVGYLFNSATLGAFHGTRSLAFYLSSLFWRAADATVPGLNDLFASESRQRLSNAYFRIAGYLTGLALWGGVVVAVINREFVGVWLGPSYYIEGSLTLAAAALIPISVIKNVSTKFALVGPRLRWYTLLVLIEGLLVIGCSFYLGRLRGPSGVVWGMLIPQAFTMTALLAKLTELFEIGLGELVLRTFRVVVRASITGVICLFLALYLVGNGNLLALAFALIVSLLIGAIGFIRFALFPEDRELLVIILSNLGQEKRAA